MECQDEEFNLVPEVPGSFSRLWNREDPWITRAVWEEEIVMDEQEGKETRKVAPE